MSKILCIIAAVVCVFALAGQASAGGVKTFQVLAVDTTANQVTFATGNGNKTITVDVTGETKLFKEGTKITIGDLVVGDTVKVRLSTDRKSASSIIVMRTAVSSSPNPPSEQ